MKSPSETVRAFIAAHYAWNERSKERCRPFETTSDDHQAAMQAAGVDYDRLIRALCLSSTVRQGIAFGDIPSHHPDKEVIESEIISTSTALVQTENTGDDGFKAKYEYHLAIEAGEWRIASLLYVNGDQKYECL